MSGEKFRKDTSKLILVLNAISHVKANCTEDLKDCQGILGMELKLRNVWTQIYLMPSSGFCRQKAVQGF